MRQIALCPIWTRPFNDDRQWRQCISERAQCAGKVPSIVRIQLAERDLIDHRRELISQQDEPRYQALIVWAHGLPMAASAVIGAAFGKLFGRASDDERPTALLTARLANQVPRNWRRGRKGADSSNDSLSPQPWGKQTEQITAAWSPLNGLHIAHE